MENAEHETIPEQGALEKVANMGESATTLAYMGLFCLQQGCSSVILFMNNCFKILSGSENGYSAMNRPLI